MNEKQPMKLQKVTQQGFTLIELLVWIVIVIIIILWITKVDFNKIWDKQRLDKKVIQIISQIETIRNNSLLWKWIWVNLDVPEKYKIDNVELNENIENSNIKEDKKPRGWHFKKEYIDSNGNVYHKGVLKSKIK